VTFAAININSTAITFINYNNSHNAIKDCEWQKIAQLKLKYNPGEPENIFWITLEKTTRKIGTKKQKKTKVSYYQRVYIGKYP